MTPLPDWRNRISCVRVGDRLISLADLASSYRRKGEEMDLTWENLLLLLQDMQKAKHTSMGNRIRFDSGDGMVYVDIFESLSTGDVHLGVAIIPEGEDADAES